MSECGPVGRAQENPLKHFFVGGTSIELESRTGWGQKRFLTLSRAQLAGFCARRSQANK